LHTLEEELVAITGEELGALCSDGGNGVHDAGQKAEDEEEQHLCRQDGEWVIEVDVRQKVAV
jgi:hypothetical protein